MRPNLYLFILISFKWRSLAVLPFVFSALAFRACSLHYGPIWLEGRESNPRQLVYKTSPITALVPSIKSRGFFSYWHLPGLNPSEPPFDFAASLTWEYLRPRSAHSLKCVFLLLVHIPFGYLTAYCSRTDSWPALTKRTSA